MILAWPFAKLPYH